MAAWARLLLALVLALRLIAAHLYFQKPGYPVKVPGQPAHLASEGASKAPLAGMTARSTSAEPVDACRSARRDR